MKLQTRAERQTASTTLSQAISQLEGLADRMRSDGLDEEAASLQTNIDDLHWQHEKLIDNELTAQ